MKYFKILFLTVLVCIMSCFCGCKIFPANTYELLSPPSLTGEYLPIGEALTKAVGKGYTLRYPSGGDIRSAVILHDPDGNGINEAFAFYSLNDEEMHINLIIQDGDKWVSADDQVITAGGVERIDFCDLDGDGKDEILVGWQIQTSAEKQLAVYSRVGKLMVQRMLQRYSGYMFCDLDGNGKKELFIQQLSTNDVVNRASVYSLEKDGIVETGSCALDRGVKSVVSITENTLSNGKKAIYIDELKSAGAVTEVLYLNKGQLVNPLLEETLGENTKTARSASLYCRDINHDGILEIPVFEEMPAVDGADTAEKIYCTKWCSFTGERLVSKQNEIINQNDGYAMIIPDKWLGNVAVSANSVRQSRAFYSQKKDKETEEVTNTRLFELTTYKIKDWEASELQNYKGRSEICRINGNVIAAKIFNEKDPYAVKLEELKKMIYVIG